MSREGIVLSSFSHILLFGLLPEGATQSQGGSSQSIETIRIVFLIRLPTHVILICSELALKPTIIDGVF